jgi:hypothetical protein
MTRRNRTILGTLGIAVVLVAGFALSQDGLGSEPEGGCWLRGWEEAGFMGSDSAIEGPGEWPDWDSEFQSIEVGGDADVMLWLKSDYQGEAVTLISGEKRSEFDSAAYRSMKMVCD